METSDFTWHVTSMGHKVKAQVQVFLLLYEAPCYEGIWAMKVIASWFNLSTGWW
jgi:hypothetical protein